MGFIAALHFLTTIPLAARRTFSPAQPGASLAYYPLVGVVLGVLLALCHWLLLWLFDTRVAAALTLVAWALVTGGLHLDGLMDACDGLFAHRPLEERLRIMRDSHVGAWGVLGAALLLITKFAALSALASHTNALSALVLAPTLARWALVLCVVVFPYGRAEGWGQTLKAQAGVRHLLLATLAMALLALLVSPLMGHIVGVCVLVSAWLIARFALDRLPGLTGDVYGMIVEVSETVALLVLAR